ncbi:MAG: HAMP domain-containing sensor histidine kinase [Thermoguttaceae bacterium]
MLSKWPIRVKLLVGLGLLVGMVAILSSGGLYATYAYRNLVKSLSWRVTELPVAAELGSRIGDLRVTLSELRGMRAGGLADFRREFMPIRVRMVREQFRVQLEDVEETLAEYRAQLEHSSSADLRMADNRPEWETVRKIETALEQVRSTNHDQGWMLDDLKVGQLETDLDHLQTLATELPSHLHNVLGGFAAEVRGQYRTLIIGIWIMSTSAALVFALFVRLFFRWILLPLRTLIHGSREVATGNFDYRIHLQTRDEMSELAEALNDMTARFQAIRDDLDRQVQQRTKQVVRNEQLASVGFLAAGVAHEINNPLASIAMCAESLEGRIGEILRAGARDGPAAQQQAIIDNYLRMIQNEAFRCKEITEKLLDFSRMGQAKRQPTELRELVAGVIDMIGHLGRYHGKHIDLGDGPPITAPVNAQEIKQVVLNLLTNALDSLDDGGRVRVELSARDGWAELCVADNGCGMDPAVLEHVFEPFFTRRRAGQGTGLGLSITHRIVADHGGTIVAQSAGPGLGATFRVQLPLAPAQVRNEQNRHAA